MGTKRTASKGHHLASKDTTAARRSPRIPAGLVEPFIRGVLCGFWLPVTRISLIAAAGARSKLRDLVAAWSDPF
jgi:hypothetical protein